MNITATLFGQMITLAVLVWFVKRFLWGPMLTVLEARKQRIADGLAAAADGLKKRQQAATDADGILAESRQQAADVINRSQQQGERIVVAAREQAKAEGERLKAAAYAEIEQHKAQAQSELQQQVVMLSLAGAERILQREVDAKAHQQSLQQLAEQLGR